MAPHLDHLPDHDRVVTRRDQRTPPAPQDREHTRRAGLPVDRISEVALEISPAMFR